MLLKSFNDPASKFDFSNGTKFERPTTDKTKQKSSQQGKILNSSHCEQNNDSYKIQISEQRKHVISFERLFSWSHLRSCEQRSIGCFTFPRARSFFTNNEADTRMLLRGEHYWNNIKKVISCTQIYSIHYIETLGKVHCAQELSDDIRSRNIVCGHWCIEDHKLQQDCLSTWI